MKQTYSGEFKAAVAIQAITGYYTLSELSYKFSVQKELVTAWKKQALNGLPDLLAGTLVKKSDYEKNILEKLYDQIVALREENEQLKNAINRQP